MTLSSLVRQKVFRSFLILQFISVSALAAVPMNEGLVQRYIDIATHMGPEMMRGQGDVQCSLPSVDGYFPFDQGKTFEAYGSDPKEVIQRVILSCVKTGCENLGKLISRSMSEAIKTPDDQAVALLQSRGYGSSDIQNFKDNKRVVDLSVLQNMTCADAPFEWQQHMVDRCLASFAVKCNR